MKVNHQIQGDFCKFGDLHVGDVFEWDNKLFMKIRQFSSMGEFAIVSLQTGMMTEKIPPGTRVRKDYGEYFSSFGRKAIVDCLTINQHQWR